MSFSLLQILTRMNRLLSLLIPSKLSPSFERGFYSRVTALETMLLWTNAKQVKNSH